MRDTVPAHIPSHISRFTKLRCSFCLSSPLERACMFLRLVASLD